MTTKLGEAKANPGQDRYKALFFAIQFLKDIVTVTEHAKCIGSLKTVDM